MLRYIKSCAFRYNIELLWNAEHDSQSDSSTQCSQSNEALEDSERIQVGLAEMFGV